NGTAGIHDKTFLFSDTFDGVTIVNKSTKDLYLRNITLLGGDDPWVDLEAPTVGLDFSLKRSVVPTLVSITNTDTTKTGAAAPDIILTGTITNPIGETRITATNGDIVSYTARGVSRPGFGLDNDKTLRTSLITTRDLILSATNGAVGYDKDFPTTDN